ncbi:MULTISPECIES: serine/threonine-protein kinase [unclassified Micromonospora]|uniref:serine/threonine-protein kinase n=1 Tax=unclassified Micromonospora TaxID=2617518 RepID=UPI003636962B
MRRGVRPCVGVGVRADNAGRCRSPRLVPGTVRQADWTIMSPFTPALRLHDRYVLRERIGLGGMSEVWRADDDVLHRPVAVKALAAQLAADPHLRATIQREARAAARLTHPHVTQVYDYGEAALGRRTVVPYLVMELVEGRSLADRLTSGPLPWPEAVPLAGQVAGALAAAHRIGVVHRDIKPGNIMLTESGAKVLDFGIAALAGPYEPRPGPLRPRPGPHEPRPRPAGEPMMGTPAYFAPERFSPGLPNPASDVYALGALLYRALAGRAPLPVQTWEDALAAHAAHRQAPPLRVPGLPPDIAALTLACLNADPARRPTAAQLARRLGSAPATEAPAEPRPAAASAPTRPVAPSTGLSLSRPWTTRRPWSSAPGPGQPRPDQVGGPSRCPRPPRARPAPRVRATVCSASSSPPGWRCSSAWSRCSPSTTGHRPRRPGRPEPSHPSTSRRPYRLRRPPPYRPPYGRGRSPCASSPPSSPT